MTESLLVDYLKELNKYNEGFDFDNTADAVDSEVIKIKQLLVLKGLCPVIKHILLLHKSKR